MAIKITSKLTPSETARLLSRAKLHAEREPTFEHAFIHISPGRYAPLYDVDPNDVARHMMTVAGRTFDYTIV